MAQGEPAGAAAPVKFSFSMAKASHRRPPLPSKGKSADPEAVVEYVTSVDAEAGVVVANPKAASGVRVVPKQEDSWRPEKRMKNIMQESDTTRSTEETFEMETMDAGPKPNVVYGLTVMSRGEVESAGGVVATRQMSLKELEDQKLRDDLLTLPEEATLEKYEELPVEEFGEALLRGMGWEKGKPIGRNAKAVVAPIEYTRRQGTLGLGAVPAPPKEINRKYIKPGESRQKWPSASSSSGESRQKRSLEEESAIKKMAELRTGNGKSEKSQERHSSREEESKGRSSFDERHSKRGHRHHREGEDERHAKRGHRYSEGDDRGERRGSKDRSKRR